MQRSRWFLSKLYKGLRPALNHFGPQGDHVKELPCSVITAARYLEENRNEPSSERLGYLRTSSHAIYIEAISKYLEDASDKFPSTYE